MAVGLNSLRTKTFDVDLVAVLAHVHHLVPVLARDHVAALVLAQDPGARAVAAQRDQGVRVVAAPSPAGAQSPRANHVPVLPASRGRSPGPATSRWTETDQRASLALVPQGSLVQSPGPAISLWIETDPYLVISPLSVMPPSSRGASQGRGLILGLVPVQCLAAAVLVEVLAGMIGTKMKRWITGIDLAQITAIKRLLF